MAKKPIIAFIVLSLVLTLPTFAEGAIASTTISYAIGFSPGGTAVNLVLDVIASAKSSILMACYSFTNRDIAEALESAAHRGVKVQIVADEGASKDKYSQVRIVSLAGIPVRIATRYAIMHNKFMVIDGVTVETGSFNYTAAAVKSNAENAIVIRNAPDIAMLYTVEWTRLWDEAKRK